MTIDGTITAKNENDMHSVEMDRIVRTSEHNIPLSEIKRLAPFAQEIDCYIKKVDGVEYFRWVLRISIGSVEYTLFSTDGHTEVLWDFETTKNLGVIARR